jgi:hypothetical protein
MMGRGMFGRGIKPSLFPPIPLPIIPLPNFGGNLVGGRQRVSQISFPKMVLRCFRWNKNGVLIKAQKTRSTNPVGIEKTHDNYRASLVITLKTAKNLVTWMFAVSTVASRQEHNAIELLRVGYGLRGSRGGIRGDYWAA